MANNTVYANNVAGTLAAGVGPSDTILLLGAGQGASFPSPSGGDWFWITVVHQSSGAVEVMQCTARSVDSLTVVRGRDGTTAISMITGSVVEMRLCAIMMREVDYRTVRGVANGLASLDGTGKLPDAQLSANVPLLTAGKLSLSVLPDEVALDSDVALKANKAGDTFTGPVTFNGTVLVTSQNAAIFSAGLWAQLSSSGDGTPLFGNNATRWADNTYRYVSTHASIGASGIVLQPFGDAGPYFFDMGDVATTAGAQFTPTLRKLFHEGNFDPASKLNTANPSSTGTATHTGTGINVGNSIVQNGDLTVYRAGGTTGAIFLNSAADRYIYWDNTYYQFNGAACRGPNFIATSDRRMKTRLRRHKVQRGVADAIQLHDWDWKRSTTIKGGGSGVIAQQVLEYAPHHVQGGDSLGVDKAGLALEGVVDLAARMREIEKVIHGLADNRTRTAVSKSRRTAR